MDNTNTLLIILHSCYLKVFVLKMLRKSGCYMKYLTSTIILLVFLLDCENSSVGYSLLS